ncbi:hypothetical protein HJC23_013701 [Cyclotella cryptica]|uniref:Uncharacterized protein n=1 Tax=Cyclotella cryptica TaxID=29204 RepID=A0ABD3QV94_9STRA
MSFNVRQPSETSRNNRRRKTYRDLTSRMFRSIGAITDQSDRGNQLLTISRSGTAKPARHSKSKKKKKQTILR